MDTTFEDLVRAAGEVREHAYAPYSCFHVGAALLAASGVVYRGCNVENASYSLTLCAERVALACAVAAGEREFAAMAVVSDASEPVLPCGACLQALAELSRDMEIISANLSGNRIRLRLEDLLPRPFRL